MKQFIAVALLSFFAANEALHRPVYKILLAQKGFAQFLQYDVETPPLKEFTFCTWVRLYDFTEDQTIYTYVAKGNNRLVRLWLERGGTTIRFSVAGRTAASVQVDLARDTWTHLCLSYQSDYGAWALYVDGHLVACEVSQALNGYVLPKGGSVLVGYGTGENGESNGIEGEVFGANMILVSTIEKNMSSQIESQYETMLFPKNKVKVNDKIKYTILSDLTIDDLKPKTMVMQLGQLKLPNDFSRYTKTSDDQDIGFDFFSNPKFFDTNPPKISKRPSDTGNKNKIPFWDIVNKTGQQGNFNRENKLKELSSSGTQDLPAISLVETPPPVDQPKETFHEMNLEFDKPPTEQSVYNMFSAVEADPNPPPESKNPIDIETPPPPQANPNVYGQWSSSKFAGTVLNYLRSINFNSKPKQQKKKIPPTIPLTKISDSLPYATEYKISNNYGRMSGSDKLYSPEFQRSSFTDKSMVKRAKREKEINVEILEDDLRENILKMHAQTKAINVEVTNRGEIDVATQRYYSTLDDQEVSAAPTPTHKPQPGPLKVSSDLKNHRLYSEGEVGSMTIMPFLKSIEYFTGSAEIADFHFPDEKQDMYTRTLEKGNKWHNTRSYNNVYTPRHIAMKTEETKNSTAENVAETNQQDQAIRVKYIAKGHKTIPIIEDDQFIEQGRRMAQTVSGTSDSGKEISSLRYNHGFLPGHMDTKKGTVVQKSDPKRKSTEQTQNNFDKPVKIGNALNEGHVLGFNNEYTRKSFIGGDEKVPDINKHRSNFDSSNKVPPSLRAQVCKSMENLYHLVLYVKPDGSIDTTNIMSPIKAINRAIEFILVNYQKCSIEDTKFEENPLVLISWSKTPVRLFGGAYPQKTKELCGFF